MNARRLTVVIPGCATWRRPGIDNPQSWLWIPGSLPSVAPRNDGVGVVGRAIR